MRIAVVGAGFLGLSAAWELIKKGHRVTIYEREDQPGGLAIGFRQPNWEWALEKHYHHIFETDTHIQQLADEIGHTYRFYDARTFSLFEENRKLEYWRLDSPITLLKLSKLPIVDRIRMGVVLGYLRYLASWQALEKYTAETWLREWMGDRSYEVLWEPLMRGKFGNLKNEVNLAWFWSRVKARSQKLGYFDGGFLGLAQNWVVKLKKQGLKIYFNHPIANLEDLTKKYDLVIVAGAPKLVKQQVKYVGTINVILQLKQKLLPQDIYWLNINLPDSPLLAIVEHTNMIDKAHYNNEHLVYLAKYLPHDHKYFELSDEQLLREYIPTLNRINPNWKKLLISFSVHKSKFTQPVMPVNYSQYIPDFSTPNPKILSASMQQVYPWDRGTNFAIELGRKLANSI